MFSFTNLILTISLACLVGQFCLWRILAMSHYCLTIILTTIISRSWCYDQVKPPHKGKTIVVREDGDVDVQLSYKKWSNEKGRFFCCALAEKHCRSPCNGLSCECQPSNFLSYFQNHKLIRNSILCISCMSCCLTLLIKD